MEKQLKGSMFIDIHTGRSHNQIWLTLLSLVFLSCGFLGIINWFNTVDFYHKHFFDHGLIVLSYNLFRVALALYVTWIIYATGYAVISLVVPYASRHKYSLSDRIILGFGTGLGVWHVLMLILGYFNLYYQLVMVGLCLIVLCASAEHFNNILREYAQSCQMPIRQKSIICILAGFSVVIAVVWLLLVRGLYPSGGGDYFTHYFYYYTNVIRNHGLAPNDVWYHYYYSKGAGLQFLGMLLMDPEAPAIMTFCCVAIAALALFNLVARLSPRTLWPVFCTILYLLYNLVSLSGGGGEFQKSHEETSAMIIMGLWAVCLYGIRQKEWEKSAFIMLTSIVIGAAILTQVVAVYFAAFFALQVGIGLISKNWRSFWFYMLLGVIATVAVFGILLMNYLVTGLATDQALNLTWKFANLERLNQWGVLPNIMMVAWIRDNYDMVAVPWRFRTVLYQLINFMRIDVLRPFVILTSLGLLCYAVEMHLTRWRIDLTSLEIKPILLNVGLFICALAMLSIFLGHSQEVSYFRFSSFFFPLVTLFCTIIWVVIGDKLKFTHHFLPVMLLTILLYSWTPWGVILVTKHAKKFLIGKYSLADAYARQPSGLTFGGIHPGAYAAIQHIPPGSRVWSTNVHSYCMAPNCQIESVISFKLSSNLNEILNSPPAVAKKILQQEKLNYFLVSKDSKLLDLLPFSQLFDPATIGKYLAVKWTDGNTYLLTWSGAGTTPIGPKFIHMYKELIQKSDHLWFRFREAVPAMNDTMKMLANTAHPWQPIIFPWRKTLSDDKAIKIHHASYA